MLNYAGSESDPLRKISAYGIGGRIGSRIHDLIFGNYMKLDLENDFLEYFRHRPFSRENSWKYIGAGKVVSAGSMLAKYCGCSEVLLRSKKFINDLLATMDPDGYIGTFCRQPDEMQLSENWVLHDMEYIILGLCDHYSCTGDRAVLDAAERMAGFIIRVFPTIPKRELVCTAGLGEAFFALYTCTGDRKYLDFGADTEHGYVPGEIQFASIRRWRQKAEGPASHVYVMLARAFAQLLLYRAEGRQDPGLLEMTGYLRRELLGRKRGGMLVTGSSSLNEHFSYEQNGKGATAETCVTAYLFRWFESQLTLSRDFRFGDIIKRSLYNALLAIMSPDARKLRYFMPFEEERPYYCTDTFCCPGNFRRIMSELHSMCWYRTDDGVAVNLYMDSVCPSVKGTGVPGNAKFEFRMQTDYPVSGRVRIDVSAPEPFPLTLSLRIPRFCREKYSLRVNGEPQPVLKPRKGAVSVRRMWNPGDVIELELPMPERWIAGRAMQKGKAAFLRGPQVFCLGKSRNADALEKHPDFDQWVLDPVPAGPPLSDTAIFPDGMLIPFTAHADGESFRVLLSEFTDESGLHTYFRLSDASAAVPDEILGDSFRPA